MSAWNRSTFGNIFRKKRNLLARLKGIQSSNVYPTSSFLQQLEKDLIGQYNDILKLEEEFWKLKSHINWLQQGDANTKFYHLTTIKRRRRNQITALKDSVGNWIYDQHTINSQIE